MKTIFRIIILLVLLLNKNSVLSQNITGTWEGVMGHEYLQINIKEEKGKLCGYTSDHYLINKKEYCKAWFTGFYDKQKKEWIITGKQFIENSGSHVLMRIIFWMPENDEKNVLSAIVTTNTSYNFFFSQRMGEKIILRKTSNDIQPLQNLPLCFADPYKKMPPVLNTPPDDNTPNHPNSNRVTDTINKIPVIENDATGSPNKQQRKRVSISNLQVNVKNIRLAVYDNGIIDGDTVSISFNGKLMVDKQVLSEDPLIINLELEENSITNEIVLYAENLGTIPPNTAIIVVTAGDKRYELYSSASLEENAVLVFDYKPK